MTKDNTARVKDDASAKILCEPKPTADFLFLRMAERPDVSAGGVELPMNSLPQLPYGRLLDKGSDCSDRFTIGDHLIVPAHAGSLIELGDGTGFYRFVRERDIVGYFATTEPAKE